MKLFKSLKSLFVKSAEVPFEVHKTVPMPDNVQKYLEQSLRPNSLWSYRDNEGEHQLFMDEMENLDLDMAS